MDEWKRSSLSQTDDGGGTRGSSYPRRDAPSKTRPRWRLDDANPLGSKINLKRGERGNPPPCRSTSGASRAVQMAGRHVRDDLAPWAGAASQATAPDSCAWRHPTCRELGPSPAKTPGLPRAPLTARSTRGSKQSRPRSSCIAAGRQAASGRRTSAYASLSHILSSFLSARWC
jgi:hypothetical protein